MQWWLFPSHNLDERNVRMIGGKRLVSAIATGALVLAGLVGCGQAQNGAAPETAAAPSEPASAQEVLDRWEADPNYKNYHTDMTAEMSATFLGQSMSMPIKLSLDVAGDNSHGTMEADLTGMGSEKMSSELYTEKDGDNYYQYTSAENGDQKSWYKTVQKDANLTEQLTSKKVMSEAEFSKTEDGGYQLSVPAEKLLEAMNDSDEFSGMLQNMDNEAMKNAISNSKAVFTFDKDCKPQKLTFVIDYSLDSSGSGTDDQGSSSGSMKVSFDIDFSNFGGIDAESVKTPEDVKKTAVDTSTVTEESGDEQPSEQKDAA